MKRILFILMFIFSFTSFSFAEDDTWITLGYSYYLPEQSGSKAPAGPVNLTVGGQVMDWVAVDLTVGYLWEKKKKNATTDINTMPVRLHFLLQPIFDTGMFEVLPYIGIGPHVAANNTDFANNIFSYGFSAKAGVRFMEDGLLFGIGVEYLYNHLEANHNGIKEKFNGSGVAFGAEIGTVF